MDILLEHKNIATNWRDYIENSCGGVRNGKLLGVNMSFEFERRRIDVRRRVPGGNPNTLTGKGNGYVTGRRGYSNSVERLRRKFLWRSKE